jgi:hypothetical protein
MLELTVHCSSPADDESEFGILSIYTYSLLYAGFYSCLLAAHYLFGNIYYNQRLLQLAMLESKRETEKGLSAVNDRQTAAKFKCAAQSAALYRCMEPACQRPPCPCHKSPCPKAPFRFLEKRRYQKVGNSSTNVSWRSDHGSRTQSRGQFRQSGLP